jgi:VanZ family protein
MAKLFVSWKDDSFFTKQGSILKYDKLEHAILGFLGMLLTHYLFRLSGIQYYFLAWLIWNLIGIIWESYQYLVQKQSIQIKDIAANNIGFFLSIIFFL